MEDLSTGSTQLFESVMVQVARDETKTEGGDLDLTLLGSAALFNSQPERPNNMELNECNR